eukprot:3706404-Rhodomonas_salina.3
MRVDAARAVAAGCVQHRALHIAPDAVPGLRSTRHRQDCHAGLSTSDPLRHSISAPRESASRDCLADAPASGNQAWGIS